jgi:hypothetical protein
MSRDHRFPGCGLEQFGFIPVKPDVIGQTGFEAITDERFDAIIRAPVDMDNELDVATDAAGMLAKGTNHAVAGLDRSLRKKRMSTLGANGYALFLQFFVYESV